MRVVEEVAVQVVVTVMVEVVVLVILDGAGSGEKEGAVFAAGWDVSCFGAGFH